MIRTQAFAIAAFSAISALALPATAVQAAGYKVTFVRGDLEQPAAVETLYADLVEAARKACKRDLMGTPYGTYLMEDCIAESVGRAVADIDAPALTAYAAGASEATVLAAAD